MGKKSKKDKVVNANDNFLTSWLRKGNLEYIEICAPFITLADWLIRKHCQEWWKNYPNERYYQNAQFGICSTLAFPRSSREWTLRTVAIDLQCNPLHLMNDSSLELSNFPPFVQDPILLLKLERILESFS